MYFGSVLNKNILVSIEKIFIPGRFWWFIQVLGHESRPIFQVWNPLLKSAISVLWLMPYYYMARMNEFVQDINECHYTTRNLLVVIDKY